MTWAPADWCQYYASKQLAFATNVEATYEEIAIAVSMLIDENGEYHLRRPVGVFYNWLG